MTPNSTDNDFARELEAARRAWEDDRPAHVKAARYDPEADRVTIELNSGATFSTPARLIQGLERATPEQLARLEVTPLGDGLRWNDLDVDIDVAALQLGVLGTRAWMSRLGELGGRVSTPEKAKAARLNGQRGGRPPSLGKTFWQRLTQAGLPRQFVLDRLVPSSLRDAFLGARGTKEKDALLPDVAAHIRQVYHWTLEDILGDQPLSFAAVAGGQARFKIPANANGERASAYVVYAHYVALLALQTTAHLTPQTLEQAPQAVCDALLGKYGAITLDTVLQDLWASGVTVLPLHDAGAFHGACWRVEGRNVIVLKQSSHSEARLLFDVLHERSHASDHPELTEFSVIEASETSAERRTSLEEQTASYRAGEIALQGQAEALTQLCVERASGSLERLKNVVQQVARERDVPVGLLANYIAFRLSLQNLNWWGAAANLQEAGRPYDIMREHFLKHARLDVLADMDRALLERALTPSHDA